MKSIAAMSLILIAACATAEQTPAAPAAAKVLNVGELRTMVEGLGHPTSIIDEKTGKFQLTITNDGLDFPVGGETSPNSRYLWLTLNLGDFEKLSGHERRAIKLLKQNTQVQPTQFYVTERGRLMMAISMENRDVTPAMLRRAIDKLIADATGTKELWQ